MTGSGPSKQLLRFFEHEHLHGVRQKSIVAACGALAEQMEILLADGPEKTTGLRKLLEAKDCFVRASLELPV